MTFNASEKDTFYSDHVTLKEQDFIALLLEN